MGAAKKLRSDKGVLSRQEIASRRKQISNQKLQTGGAGRRVIAGVFVLAFSLLGLFALGSYAPEDRVGPGYKNLVGPFGHLIGDGLFGLLGFTAYVLPLAGLYAAVVMFVGGKEKRRWPQVLSALLLCASGAVLAHLMFHGDPGWKYPPGGALGSTLGAILGGWFSTLGTVILVSAVSVAALIVGTQFAFLKVLAFFGRALTAFAKRAQAWAIAFWEEQQKAMAERREAAAKAKLEEQAFLAQLEADDEELAEAEREAIEAEAMAEEVVRLAKQKEERERKIAEEKAAKAAAKDAKKAPALVARTEDEADEEDDAPLPPVKTDALAPRARALPSDPAWAQSFPSTPASKVPPPVEAAPPEKESKKRKQPAIVTAPVASTPPVPAEKLPAVPAPLAEVATGALAAAPFAAAAAAAGPIAQSSSALARMPLIVEPKAPPKPTAKKQEQFEFVGDRKSFSLPPLDVLEADKKERTSIDKEAFLSTAEKLRAKLADFGIVGEVVEIRPGPVVTMYEFLPGPGIKVSKIASLADDLAMAMEAMRVRIVAPIPGKGVVGIEVPNRDRETVFLKEIAEQDAFTKSASKITMCVGKDIEGMPYVLDLAKAPHLLMAGTTGSGKSVAVNSMIMSILLKSTPEEVRFIMVDPKMLELSVYEGIPHLLLPVVTDPKKAALALRWAVEEMERRYHLLSEAGVRNIAGYNKLVETSEGAAKEALKNAEAKRPSPIKPAAERKASAPAAPPKKMLIVDVAEGETEEAALERSQTPAFGVAAPKDEVGELREAVTGEVEESQPAGFEPVSLDAADDEPLPELTAAPESASEPEGDKKELKKLPYIVVIIDELADLMMVASREVETYIARLAQMARAAGIHLMVATQRPSTDVVTGVIKANFPTRISFMLRSKPDSMTILGTVGAEALLGMGDMLIMPPTSAHMQRVHGAYVSEHEIKRAVDHLKAQGKPVYDESILKPREEESEGGGGEDELSDELYDQALAVVGEMRSVSISMLQRKMRIGYNRAARMIERMERDGVVGPADGAKPREVLIRAVGEMPGAGAM